MIRAIIHIVSYVIIIMVLLKTYRELLKAWKSIEILNEVLDDIDRKRWQAFDMLEDNMRTFENANVLDIQYETLREYEDLPYPYWEIASLVAAIERLKHQKEV